VFLADLRILYHLLISRPRGTDAGARLEAFYRGQAKGYDDFRRRLLHGREEMMRALEVPEGAHLIDMGGGTGSNLEYLDEQWHRLSKVTLVDLCPPLLEVAAERIRQQQWHKASTVLADATSYEPSDGPVDVITFSYSLSMIPEWQRAVDRAHAILKPGGMIGIADFYISSPSPPPERHKHSRFQRSFWPRWFGWDHVFLSPEYLPYLQNRFQIVRLEERLGRVPYLFGLRAPYYIFLGRKL
jgi:S-adenosylmethionine-diacylgycerolhomoserine-N-methlytransferase